MSKSIFLKTSALGLVLAVAGCQSYVERHDGVTTFAGDAQSVNEVKMVEDHWKRNAENTHIPGDGTRLADAVVRYKGANAPEVSSEQ